MRKNNVFLILLVLLESFSGFGQTAVCTSGQAPSFSGFGYPVFPKTQTSKHLESVDRLNGGNFLFALDSTVIMNTFPPDQWRPDGRSGNKEEFTYTAENWLASNLYFEWNSMESRWFGSYGTSYTYDDRGNIIRSSDLGWKSETGNWSALNRHDITYI